MRSGLTSMAIFSIAACLAVALELRGAAPAQANPDQAAPASRPSGDPSRRMKADDLLGPGRPADAPAASQPATSAQAPADLQAGSGRSRTPEQANVLKELLRDSDRPPTAPPTKARWGAQPTRKPVSDENLLAEGQLIVERSGRFIRQGDHAAFQFIAEEKGGQTLTLELLENAWLDYMEQEASGQEAEFIVTAEATQYRGRNFLLLRSFRRQVSHGNIAP